MRRAKIVCTLGPAVDTPERIRALVDAGMDVARLNLSHGAYADHEKVYQMVREASDASGHGVGILADLQGPKIRLGRFADGPVQLEQGDEFTITTRDVPGDATICSTTYDGLPGDVARRRPRSSSTTARSASRSSSVDDTDVRTRVLVAGAGEQQQGHQPARCRRVACPRCPRRTRRTCAGRCT